MKSSGAPVALGPSYAQNLPFRKEPKKPMTVRRFYLLLFAFVLFLGFLVGEYFCCGVFYRLVRPLDSVELDGLCGLCAPVLCYGIFHGALAAARREKIPVAVIAGFFLFFTFLLGFFLRFSLQLANGALDPSDPENHVVIVTSKKISSWGGSILEGMNPMAHLVYFRDWELEGRDCEMLTPQDFYYAVDVGSRVEVTLRGGLFHWPWMEGCQLLATPPRSL